MMHSKSKTIALFAAFSFIALFSKCVIPVHAQINNPGSGAEISGSVTNGHCAVFGPSTNQIQDVGPCSAGSLVTSVFGRTGNIAAVSGDYTFGLIGGTIVAGQYGAGSIFNADVNASAAVVSTKLSFTGVGSSSVARTVDSKLNDWVSIRDKGALGNLIHDDAPALRAAVATAISNGTYQVQTPAGLYLLDSCVTNGAGVKSVIDLSGTLKNKGLSIKGTGWRIGTGSDATAWQGSVFVLGPNIPDDCDFLYMAGDAQVHGMLFEDFAVVSATGTYSSVGYGRNIFNFDATPNDAFQIYFSTINRVFAGNTKTGKSFNANANSSNAGGVWAFSKVTNSFLMSYRCSFCGDNIDVTGNTLGSNATGGNVTVYSSQVTGATDFRIAGNNIANNANCPLYINNGTNVVIRDNEFEQADVANVCDAVITIAGGIAVVHNVMVESNSISQGSTISGIVCLKVDAAVEVFYDRNRCSVPTGQTHVWTTALSQLTRVGWMNEYTINGAIGSPTILDLGAATLVMNSVDGTLTVGNLGATNAKFNVKDSFEVIGATSPVARVQWTDTSSFGSFYFYEAGALRAGFQVIGSAFGTAGRRNNLEFFAGAGAITFDSGNDGAFELRLFPEGDTVTGNAALATNATHGFLYMPSSAGAPTGTPGRIISGVVPMVIDTTNKKFCYYNGAWECSAAFTP